MRLLCFRAIEGHPRVLQSCFALDLTAEFNSSSLYFEVRTLLTNRLGPPLSREFSIILFNFSTSFHYNIPHHLKTAFYHIANSQSIKNNKVFTRPLLRMCIGIQFLLSPLGSHLIPSKLKLDFPKKILLLFKKQLGLFF